MIRISDVSKSYGELLAVDRLSFAIQKGEIFGLLGPNGAGKSTAIAITCGLLVPDRGEVQVNGHRPVSKAAKRQIGLAPQSLAMYEDLTGLDNLHFFGSLYGLEKPLLEERIQWVLEFSGLTDRAKDRVETYSGGMQRRLNLAISLLHDPEYLLLDEPTVGVDPQSRNKLFDCVLALKARGKTIIYTTHYMEEAQRLCDRVGIIDHGRLLALGTVDELIGEHGGDGEISVTTAEQTIVKTTGRPIADMKALLDAHDDIRDLKLIRPSLESVFLNLTGRQLRD